jgi:hypothetical protein
MHQGTDRFSLSKTTVGACVPNNTGNLESHDRARVWRRRIKTHALEHISTVNACKRNINNDLVSRAA